MKKASSKGAIKFAAVGLVIAIGLTVSVMNVAKYKYRPHLNDNLYLPSGKFISEISLGYKQISADLVWLSAVQYYGGYRQDENDLAYFEGLINLVTTLDPHFVFAYVFGALVVSSDIGAFDNAIAILKRGMQHNPTSWKLPFEAGFLYYVSAANADLAARYFDLASRIPGAPEITKRFAAFIYSKAGHKKTSIRMWEELIETTDEPYMRELAERYVEKLRKELDGGAGF